MNPILNQLNRSALNPQIQQIKNLMRMAQGGPQGMVQNMLQNNPQYKQVMDFVRQNDGDPKKAFYMMAKQKGMDPDAIIKELMQ